MLVFADEFRLGASRRVVSSGRVAIQLRNIGEDDHDLRIRRRGGRGIAKTRVVRPKGLVTLRVRLRPGRYELFCAVGDHEARGMRAPLVVKRPARRPARGPR